MCVFGDWITGKYLKWRGEKIGQEGGASEFARYLDVKQPVLSDWMSGKKEPRTPQMINKLVDKYGPEVYTVLGYDAPNNSPDPDHMTDEELLVYISKRFSIPADELSYVLKLGRSPVEKRK